MWLLLHVRKLKSASARPLKTIVTNLIYHRVNCLVDIESRSYRTTIIKDYLNVFIITLHFLFQTLICNRVFQNKTKVYMDLILGAAL